jgi:hypothetical protein
VSPDGGPRSHQSVQNPDRSSLQDKDLRGLIDSKYWTTYMAGSPAKSRGCANIAAGMGCKGSRVQISALRPIKTRGCVPLCGKRGPETA